MKILVINSFFSPFGGAESIAYDTYKLLKKQGHEVYFYATNRPPFFEEQYEYVNYFPQDNFTTKGYLKNPVQYYYNKNNRVKLNEFLELIQPDVIHLHNVLAFSPAILKCCRTYPNVLTVHQADIVCPASTLMLQNKKLCTKQLCQKGNYWPCIINNCVRNNIEASIRRACLISLYTRNLKYINKYITPSLALKNAILNCHINIAENQIITIPNFLNNTFFKNTPNYSNKNYFLYIGRLSKEKKVITLLRALKDLPREIKLKIAGTGTEEKALKQYAIENKLNNVEFLGFKNREEVNDLYQNCISTILPCNWFEIFGMTNIESFINGKPVIASNIGGIPEIVEDNINGLLFEPGNIEQLKECILKYWNNPNLVVDHGKNGYQKAITQYTEEKYYNELMKVYEEVLNESKR